ncbi:hypothetical protein HPB47_000707 [Ixodes persulcatus]|uniref:Uncharacterized protein n=1 Tax=Ixodes persulcatus TaxID=34615 RepID=A0AC60PSP8_IXOPE|nr:hypothetical protein HPB47_000707 [Ixodes persulcatus]
MEDCNAPNDEAVELLRRKAKMNETRRKDDGRREESAESRLHANHSRAGGRYVVLTPSGGGRGGSRAVSQGHTRYISAAQINPAKVSAIVGVRTAECLHPAFFVFGASERRFGTTH